MVLEVAILNIKNGRTSEFEASFKKASLIIETMKGYIRHELKKCIERPDQYILLVQWETLEDHEEGFRKSNEYQDWKNLLHRYYEPFPEVLHYS
ncbi:antibiotic biosynthesis monooxygenase family protein [Flagellimonas algicola]|uniref:Antibiotic biosynthesis monooxygenase n=1 Tax=Flagellimonas algicola TaxID=2583815 RepID=A0ABY2WI18_9FLAO|nr:antibiotic biosynthesis monooxygenase [Allomuricauda algicola]TMU50961.1 antibiotic biosynthesis monooxygenase [Allomuricauda algicola]